jgi:hypothetical protein
MEGQYEKCGLPQINIIVHIIIYHYVEIMDIYDL